ncbi:MAG: phage tail protein, partial [Pseudobutyrivibrio sp.]|nr:phage tail protein [Pseudobutyrivibrio sp.]
MGIIYRVQLDGVDIFSPSKELGLLSTKLSLEINAAGTFTFTMPPCHTYYNAPKVMLSIVEILENDVSLFYGRVIEIKTNWNNEKEITCEGALAFFNDSIQRPRIWPPVGGTTTPESFLRDLIAVHNEQVSSDKAITIGSIDSSFNLTQIARSVDYCNTFNAIKEQCLDTNGGYMYIKRENNANVLYWVTENENASQPVQFGLNLLDLNTDISVEDLVTAVLPLGRDDNNNYVTISTSTVEVGDYPINGDYIYDQDLVEKYGTLLEVVNFDDVIVPQQLYNSACDYLKSKKLNFDGIVIDCSVAELRYLNSDYDAFNLGQLVHVSSTPHKTAVTDVEIDEDLMISRVEYNLNDASKSITIGNIPRQALSDKVSSSSG